MIELPFFTGEHPGGRRLGQDEAQGQRHGPHDGHQGKHQNYTVFFIINRKFSRDNESSICKKNFYYMELLYKSRIKIYIVL